VLGERLRRFLEKSADLCDDLDYVDEDLTPDSHINTWAAAGHVFPVVRSAVANTRNLVFLVAFVKNPSPLLLCGFLSADLQETDLRC